MYFKGGRPRVRDNQGEEFFSVFDLGQSGRPAFRVERETETQTPSGVNGSEKLHGGHHVSVRMRMR